MSGSKSSAFPTFQPLPTLALPQLPQEVVNLCRQHTHASQLSLEAVQERSQEEEMGTQRQPFQEVFIDRPSNRERELEQQVQSLKQELTRLQQERYGKFDYSLISARGRSKSQQVVPPTIQVTLPPPTPKNYQALQQQLQRYQECTYEYQRQIHRYQTLVQQLNTRIGTLEAQLVSARTQHNTSPFKSAHPMHHTTFQHTPTVSPFTAQADTAKKENGESEEFQHEIRRLKNEIIYKDVCMQRMKAQSQQRHLKLQKHLFLSVEQNGRLASQIELITQSFQEQLVEMARFLEKQRRHKLTQGTAKYMFKTGDEQRERWNQGVQMLKIRRDQGLI